ncbi:5478_t:CDS:2, partial [Acaulospora colombiana]
ASGLAKYPYALAVNGTPNEFTMCAWTSIVPYPTQFDIIYQKASIKPVGAKNHAKHSSSISSRRVLQHKGANLMHTASINLLNSQKNTLTLEGGCRVISWTWPDVTSLLTIGRPDGGREYRAQDRAIQIPVIRSLHRSSGSLES